jgi:hypothetical protein
MINPKEISTTSEAYKVLNGPSANATVKDGYSRVVQPGDIIIIPPDVFHGWTEDNRSRGLSERSSGPGSRFARGLCEPGDQEVRQARPCCTGCAVPFRAIS